MANAARYTADDVGRQGRWWLTLRGTQLMMSYDVAARQSLTEYCQESRLLQTRMRWCNVLWRSYHRHSIGTHNVPCNLTDREKTWRCRRRWIHSHSSSLLAAVTNVVYSAIFLLLPSWWFSSSLHFIMLHGALKLYCFLFEQQLQNEPILIFLVAESRWTTTSMIR